MSSLLETLLVTAIAAVTTALLTPLVRALALRRGQVSEAREDRWHTRPTPAIGGVAIVAGFVVALAVEIVIASPEQFDLWEGSQGILPLTPRRGLLLGVALVSVLGFVDDLVQLRPGAKLLGQIAAAAILIGSGLGVWLTGIYAIDVFISMFWFVGITNAMNLLDNMDGLAGGIGAIAAFFIGVNIVLNAGSITPMATVAFAFSGALVGFLVHNYPPAKIFMGDAGSLFIGLSLAGLALTPAQGAGRGLFAIVAVPVVVLAIPILDTTFVTVTRLFERRAISQGGRDHTSHGLVALGVSEERAVWILWSLAITGGAIGLAVRDASRTFALLTGSALLIVLTLIGAFLLISRMRRLERDEEVAKTETFLRFRRLHERFPVLSLLMDTVLIGFAYWLAYLVRWDAGQLAAELLYFQGSLVIVIAAKAVAFVATNAYNTRWSQFGLPEVVAIARTNLIATLFTVAVLYLWQAEGLSRGVVLLDFVLCFGLTTAWRTSFQVMHQTQQRWSVTGIPVVVVGGSRDADLVLQAMRRNMEPRFRIRAIVDPELRPSGTRFRGYRVYSGPEGLATAVEKHGVTGAVLVRFEGLTSPGEALLDAYLDEVGSLDVITVDVGVNFRSVHELPST